MRRIRNALLGLVVFGLAIQLVPYGRDHANPEVTGEPAWDRPATRELFFRACRDCHSNETVWPWYSFVAPASWLVQRDVDEGRSHFNASEWGRDDHNHGDEAAKMVRRQEMPPWFYLPAHPEARLSEPEREALVAGLVATFGDEESDRRAHDHDHGHEH